jgi:PAS domain S-box-containing protein
LKKSDNKSETAATLRQKAEERLRNKLAGLINHQPVNSLDPEIYKLIHELEVHQIELEMQNEELVLSKLQAEAATDKYSELYDFAPSGYFTLSREGEILELNLLGSQMLGKDREHLRNRRFGQFVSEKTVSTFNRFLEKIFQSKIPASCELIFKRDGGNPFNVHLSGIINGDGMQCLITVTDISSLKLIENELTKSETKFRTLFESANDAILIMNDTGFTDCNTKTEIVFGWLKEDIIGHSPVDFSPLTQPDGRLSSEKAKEKIHAALAGETQFFYWKHQRFNGTTFDAEVSLNKLEIDGEACVQAIVRDVSVHKEMEKALKDSENQAQSLLSAIPDLMFRLSSEGVYLDFKAASEDLAYQKQSIVGLKNRDIMPPEFADFIDDKMNQCLKNGQMQVFEYQLELPLKGMCVYEARMVPGGNDEVIAIVRDVTDRKNAEKVIALKNAQLIQANAEKDKFFSIIAHDLRSPFNAFLGFTQLLVDELDTFTLKEIQNIAVRMRNSATNLFALLENLLEWSRMKRGLTLFEPALFLLKTAILKSVETALEPANKKGIEIKLEIPENIEVNADVYMLESTIRNLVSNAIKFTPEGGKVIISAEPAINNTVKISIRDTGIGMNQELISNLFCLDVNTNRKGTQEEPSTGLGLLLCKEFIEKHGKELWVESEAGKGSVFYFTLPGR